MSEVELKFSDHGLAKELSSLDIADIKVRRKINVLDCAEPEVMSTLNNTFTFIVTTGSSVALSLFSSWLYDKLKSKGNIDNVQINGVQISGDNNNLKIEIHNHIQSQDNKIQS
ncbi:hypothetical protein ACSZNF_19125 [Aeromonas hydrophila]